MALLGIAQQFSGTRAIYWFYDVSDYVGNAFGPYVNGNHFAAYEVMAILLGLGMLLSHEPNHRRADHASWRQTLSRAFAPERMLLLVCLLVMVSALIMSRSRGGFLAFLFGLIGFAVILRFRPRGTRRRGLLSVFIVIGVVTLWLGGPLILRFLQIFTGQEALPWGGGRLAVYQSTWNMAKDFPLFGIGYEAFASVFPRYQQPGAFPQSYAHAHNDVLQLLAETGGIGFTLVVAGVVIGFVSIVRRWRQRRDPFVQVMVPAGLAACLAIGVHSLVDFNLHIPANALVATTILALMFACVNVSGRRGPVETEVTKSSGALRRLGMRVAPWAVLGIILWLSVVAVRVAVADWFYPQLRSPNHLHWTYKAALGVRLDRLEQALRWTPYNPVY